MKKYLMTGMAALAICAAFTSCSKDTDVYNSGVIENNDKQSIVNNYNEAFVKTFGQPAANHQWGFVNYAKSSTRADGDPEVVKKDVWDNFPDKLDGNAVPADVTPAEAAYVYEWFQKEENKGLTEEGQPWTDFFIQQVYGTMDKQKKGIWHRYDQNRVNNGYDSNYYDEEFTDKGGMDYLTVGDGTTMTHVLDFNAEKGGPWGIVYMKNSSAMQFGYHGSWDSSDRQLFKLAQITVPGECFGEGEADRTAWYVGLSLLAEKDDNGKKVLGEQRKDWGDDWILKVVPGKSKVEEPEYTLRVICEDLNAQAQAGDTEDSDWDFNDLVFDVAFLGSDQVQIQVVAVGGTMPIRINGEDALEAHGLYDQGTNIMINTGAGAKYPSQAYESNGIPAKAIFTRTISGVDAAFGRNIKVEVQKNGQWIELEAKAGQPAAKMGVMPDFNPCTERQDITSRYSNFVAWVNTQSPSRWWAE